MDEKTISELLDQFDKSSLKDFELSQDNFTLKLSKQENRPVAPVINEVPVAQPTQPVASSQPIAEEPPVAPATDNLVVKSPLVGIFYDTPKPDQPQFKQIGDHVNEGDVICVIESMKVINEIKSDHSGTLVAQLVESGDMVEYDQPLFEIKE